MPKHVQLRDVLAQNIRRHRAQLGLSQEQLADACGLHRTYIGSVERSERNVSLSTLEALARALDVTVPSLLTPRVQ
ncbi:helix-turn-helix transcriptional regulator [Deltaproteobacteria bacterium PRO3]|nr:helix-turn-helix transcriptional regulator [Deltaproteobacteria bacterium PRO3]